MAATNPTCFPMIFYGNLQPRATDFGSGHAFTENLHFRGPHLGDRKTRATNCRPGHTFTEGLHSEGFTLGVYNLGETILDLVMHSLGVYTGLQFGGIQSAANFGPGHALYILGATL